MACTRRGIATGRREAKRGLLRAAAGLPACDAIPHRLRRQRGRVLRPRPALARAACARLLPPPDGRPAARSAEPRHRRPVLSGLRRRHRAVRRAAGAAGPILAQRAAARPRARRGRYGTYDLTNLATLRRWPPALAAVDLAWGSLLTGLAATAGYLAARASS